MRILFCKNSFAGPMSGADEIVVSYAIQLKAAGYSPTVLLVHSAEDADPLAARLREGGVPLASLASPNFSTSLATGRRLVIAAMRVVSPARRLIRTSSRKLVFELIQRYHDDFCRYLTRHRPDLVHVMTPDPGAVMLIRAAHSVGVPVIYQEVGIPFHPPGFEEVYQRFTSVLPLCSDIATLSPRLAQEMNRVIPRIRTPRVVPLMSHDPANGLPKTNSTRDSVCFGFASRLEHLKGPLRLIDGFRLASNAHPFISLKIAGEGSQRPQIVRAIRRFALEDKCQLMGVYTTLEDRSRFMHDIDVFVLPSLTEGTPNVVIEAMAHGKPIIATNVGGIPDFVNQDVGILVPTEDTEALGAAMTCLANSPEMRARMGRAARATYEQMFAPQAVLPLLLDFYRSVIEAYSPGYEPIGQPAKIFDHPWSAGQVPLAILDPELL